MLLYKKEWSDFNFLNIIINIPNIYIKKSKFDPFAEEYLTGLDIPTKLLYTTDNLTFWEYDMSMFGFGISILRQYSY